MWMPSKLLDRSRKIVLTSRNSSFCDAGRVVSFEYETMVGMGGPAKRAFNYGQPARTIRPIAPWGAIDYWHGYRMRKLSRAFKMGTQFYQVGEARNVDESEVGGAHARCTSKR
jgi:hypothetical protein